jgi:RHS repeat-associated protein
MTTLTDARNIQFLQNFYDANGRVWKQVGADPSIVYLFSYIVSYNNVIATTITDPNGNVRVMNFGTPPVSPDGVSIAAPYASTDIWAVNKPEQQTVTYVRDPQTNLLLSTTDSLNRTTSYTYDIAGNTTSVTALAGTPNAVTANFSYGNNYSLLTGITDPLSHATSFAYDSKGNLIGVTDPTGNAYTYVYDFVGRVTTATDPLGNAFHFGYSGADLSSMTNPVGSIVNLLTDGGGRTVAMSDPVGGLTRLQYNPLNRLIQKTDKLGGVTSLQWDPNGRIQSVTDARNAPNATVYSYDNVDRLHNRTDPLGNISTFAYDPNGNVTCSTDRRGKASVIQYDGLNRPTSVGFGATSCASTAFESTTTYSYDVGDRVTSVADSTSGTIVPVFDPLDRLTSETTPQGTVSYQYDAAGRKTAMAVAGQPIVNYSYDSLDRLTNVTQSSSSVFLQYDSASRRQSLTLPNGVTVAYLYDATSHLTGVTYQKGANILGNLSYVYDAFGRASGVSGSFARTGLPAAVPSATYDVANRLTTWAGQSLSYDPTGNLVGDGLNIYNWDGRNQLSSITGNVNGGFAYDPSGRRTGKSVGGTTTEYLYDGLNIVQEISGTSPTANLLRGGMDEIFIRTDTGSASFLTDPLGNTLALTDSNGALTTQYTYEPFGKVSSTGPTSANPFQFTGRDNDGTGLQFNRARYYNPGLQRFISQDPIGFAGGQTNLYSYVGNSPINLVDPLGLQAFPQYFNPWQFPGWLNSANYDDIMFEEFATGTGPYHRDFGPSSSEVQDLQYSSGVNKARDYYSRCGSGRTVTGGHKFGLQGVQDSGLNPTLQFIGEYDWTISPNAYGTLTYTITDYKSMHSLSYHLLPSWSRDPFGQGWSLPFGNTEQTYHWTEPAPVKDMGGRKSGC